MPSCGSTYFRLYRVGVRCVLYRGRGQCHNFSIFRSAGQRMMMIGNNSRGMRRRRNVCHGATESETSRGWKDGRVWRGLDCAAATVEQRPADTAALFASTPPLQENADHSVTSASHTASLHPPSNVLCHLLVRKVRTSCRQASASAAGRCPRQLRSDGEMRPCCCCLPCYLQCGFSDIDLCVTRRCAGCRVLRERSGGRYHVLFVVAPAPGGPAARVAAVRMVQRDDDMRQLRRGDSVDEEDDVFSGNKQSKSD